MQKTHDGHRRFLLPTGFQCGEAGGSVVDIDQAKRYVVVVLNVAHQQPGYRAVARPKGVQGQQVEVNLERRLQLPIEAKYQIGM